MLKTVDDSHDFKVEAEQYQNLTFHRQDVILMVSIKSRFHITLEPRSLDFLIFGGYEQAGESQKLVPLSRYKFLVAVFVDDADSEVESAGSEFHLVLEGDEPADEKLAHGDGYVGMPEHVVIGDVAAAFVGFVALGDLGEVGRDFGVHCQPLAGGILFGGVLGVGGQVCQV